MVYWPSAVRFRNQHEI